MEVVAGHDPVSIIYQVLSVFGSPGGSSVGSDIDCYPTRSDWYLVNCEVPV